MAKDEDATSTGNAIFLMIFVFVALCEIIGGAFDYFAASYAPQEIVGEIAFGFGTLTLTLVAIGSAIIENINKAAACAAVYAELLGKDGPLLQELREQGDDRVREHSEMINVMSGLAALGRPANEGQ